jgi:hypothetical protein
LAIKQDRDALKFAKIQFSKIIAWNNLNNELN